MGKTKKRNKANDFIITNYGIYNEVTGSSVLLEVDGLKILLDLGLYQNNSLSGKEGFVVNVKSKHGIPFHELDAVIVTHMHADHCGMLPILLRPDVDFRGGIYVTEPTAPLISAVCCDSAFIQSEVVKAHNRKNPKNELYPIYTIDEAEQIIKHLRGYRYNEQIWLNDRVYFEFIPNGHIFGSASVYLTYMIDEYTTRRLLFTGDYNYNPKIPRSFTKEWDVNRILEPNVVITESTYGDKLHTWIEPEQLLEQYVIDEVINKGQVLIMPAFSIGRSTQLLSMMKHIYDNNKVLVDRKIPIYFCGKMTQKAHSILGNQYYAQHFVDERWLKDYDVFNWGRVQKVDNFNDLESLTDKQPKIIITSGGMGSGYSSYLLQQLVNKPWCSILASGYASQGTPVHTILSAKEEGRTIVSIQGKQYKLKANVLKPLEMSGHADYKQMCQLLTKGCDQNKLTDVIIIHGDEEAKANLKEEILKRNRDVNVTIAIPKNSVKC